MKKRTKAIARAIPVFLRFPLMALMGLLLCCAEQGKIGEAGVDCGDHGTEHAGHCHCDTGYLFDGMTCVDPEEITIPCGDHVDDGGIDGSDHDHGVCVCPVTGDCACDEGEIVTVGGLDYCARSFTSNDQISNNRGSVDRAPECVHRIWRSILSRGN